MQFLFAIPIHALSKLFMDQKKSLGSMPLLHFFFLTELEGREPLQEFI